MMEHRTLEGHLLIGVLQMALHNALIIMACLGMQLSQSAKVIPVMFLMDLVLKMDLINVVVVVDHLQL